MSSVDLHPVVATVGIRNIMTDHWLADEEGPFGFTSPTEAECWLEKNVPETRKGVYDVDRFRGNEYKEAVEIMQRQKTIKAQRLVNGELETVSIPIVHTTFGDDVAATLADAPPAKDHGPGPVCAVGRHSLEVAFVFLVASFGISWFPGVFGLPWLPVTIGVAFIALVCGIEWPKLPSLNDPTKTDAHKIE